MIPILLLMALCWPLLLALPALQKSLPQPCLLAMLPVALLILLPVNTALELPWFLMGSGFSIDGQTRWLLAMTLLIWICAEIMSPATHTGTLSLRLLIFTGQIGALLASDLVAFFSFSTLMSYSFYGLIYQSAPGGTRLASRFYLFANIIADLMLFEAMLLTYTVSSDMQYQTIRETFANLAHADVYLWLALVAFMLKGGFWPFHSWLTASACTAPVPGRWLLIVVPQLIAIIGLIQWLPFGYGDADSQANVMQIIGIIAIVYALVKFLVRPTGSALVWISFAISGSMFTLLGFGLEHTVYWLRYEHLVYPLLAAIGITSSLLLLKFSRQKTTQIPPVSILFKIDTLLLWAQKHFYRHQQQLDNSLVHMRLRIEALIHLAAQRVHPLLQINARWHRVMVIFVLLILGLSWSA